MKSVLFTLVAATILVACGKKEEAPALAPVVTSTPAPAPAPVASEPAKTEEAKK